MTYGEKEARDIGSVVDYVRDRFKVKKVALWGRSMGASLAMMYTSLHPRHIFCLILDTPFRRLREVLFPRRRWCSMLPNTTTSPSPAS